MLALSGPTQCGLVTRFRSAALSILISLMYCFVGSLKDVKIDAPAAVAFGETVTLICTFDLEKDELYSVKWYKNRQEFFRYVPKELPHVKVFPVPGVDVDVSRSGQDRVVLRNAHWDLSAKFKCEVSTDLPFFHTGVVTAQLHVVDPPKGTPTMKFEKTTYSSGEIVRGNCISPPSTPPTNITWLVNDAEMKSSFENVTVIGTKENGQPARYVKTSEIEFPVNSYHSGKLNIVCTADLYNVFFARNSTILEDEKPKLAPILSAAATGIPNTSSKYTLLLCILCTIQRYSIIQRISR